MMSAFTFHPAWFYKSPACPPADLKTPADAARWEADQLYRACGTGACVSERAGMGDMFIITPENGGYRVTGGPTGVLYGVHALSRALLTGTPVPEGEQAPRYPLRMLNGWDDPMGTVERGYAGRSLWFEGGGFNYDPDRIRYLGRMLASVGINALCVNNVNVHEPAEGLIDELLPDLAAFAALLRPFGVRLMTSVDFAQPIRDGLPTADPLDEGVQAWWARRADAVWAAIPDFCGFLVKADSEHRPGPFTYGRSHAEGANMLARAVAPHGGRVVWRAFVYNCMQDWRDHSIDRPCAAYDTYMPLDGAFDENVILQVKNGPYDFQVREPVSPTLLGMEKTALAVEFQLAQEYTGHQIDLYALATVFRDFFDDVQAERLQAIAAVTNIGRDESLFGHPFAAANLYCYGKFAWNPGESAEESLRAWARLSYPEAAGDLAEKLMIPSRTVYERYTATLGLGWMVTPGDHYGPSPSGYEYDRWGTYHRANREAVGIDRTREGTGYAAQYPPELEVRYSDPETCPENLLLFFHRIPYAWRMQDGRTLIQRIYDDHFEGAAMVEQMAAVLAELPLPSPDREEALRRMEDQCRYAGEGRDVINTFFRRLSGADDVHGRMIYD